MEIQPQPEQIQTGINPELVQNIVSGDAAYDNEWVKFMSQLSKNKSVNDIVEYINTVHWSRRQQKTIMAYSRVILGGVFATTNFQNHNDYRMLYDDKTI